MLKRIALQRVEYMPRELSPGILYVSEEFAVAGHLCACGCGNKVITPLGPAEWQFSEHGGLPSLSPSIGSWQLPCRSHYWIANGLIEWAPQWTNAQIAAGRHAEQERRSAYYDSRNRKLSIWIRMYRFIRNFLGGF